MVLFVLIECFLCFCSSVFSGMIKNLLNILSSSSRLNVGSSDCCIVKVIIVILIKILVGIQCDIVFRVISFVVVLVFSIIFIVIIVLRQVGMVLLVMFSVIGIQIISRKCRVMLVFQNRLVFISEKWVLLLCYSVWQVLKKLCVIGLKCYDCFGCVVGSLGIYRLVIIVLLQISVQMISVVSMCQLVRILLVMEFSRIVVMVEDFISLLVFINLLLVVSLLRMLYLVGEQVVVLIFISVQLINGLMLKQMQLVLSSFRLLVIIIIWFLVKLLVN